MKILIFRDTELKDLNPDIMDRQGLAGTENSVICLARALSRRQHTVKVICPISLEKSYDNVRYTPLRSYAEAAVLCTMFNPDVLIVAGNPKILFTTPIQAKKIIFWQQNHPAELADRFNIPELFERSNLIIVAPSPEAAIFYSHAYRNNRIWGIYNGIRPEFFNVELNPLKGTVLYCGSFTRAKGLSVVLDLARSLPELNFRLCGSFDLYGFKDIDYERLCMSQAKDLKNISFAGSLNASKLATEMSQAEICIVNPLIGNHETCCVSALEAMAVGIPVLAGGKSIIDPIIVHGGLSCNELESWPELVKDLMGNPKKRYLLVRESGREFTRNLDWDHIAAEWNKLFAEGSTKTCPTCKGTGEHYHEIDESSYLCCETCNGKGVI